MLNMKCVGERSEDMGGRPRLLSSSSSSSSTGGSSWQLFDEKGGKFLSLRSYGVKCVFV